MHFDKNIPPMYDLPLKSGKVINEIVGMNRFSDGKNSKNLQFLASVFYASFR